MPQAEGFYQLQTHYYEDQNPAIRSTYNIHIE
jgi:hypothetical protein